MNSDHSDFRIEVASEKHFHLAPLIAETMSRSAAARGTGISKRSPDTLIDYMRAGNAMIAMYHDNTWAGFCYLACWQNGLFVSNSGLIVAPEFREHGIATQLKTKIFELCRYKYPQASMVGITTSAAVMKINTELGFYPTAFSEMPHDEQFWKGCASCVNHDILQRTGKKFCLCTAMRFDPAIKIETV
ncbi:GNAT family N-acetyltransferase [Ohtaekwangia kribbensis]|jgi:hypothetical protein|uniref:GNAT family N-acetyltransferase n=1 Tax=Ohtaekwangia kribbensis TaxID=688913 RepID=A0ABW3JZN2_9BACT